MYECEVLADSVGSSGKRLTTVIVTYPRFVHAEMLTHRMFSRNSASSRAIPNEKLRERVVRDPAMPVWWGKNQAGMQAREELSGGEIDAARRTWLNARDAMLATSQALADGGLHKQLCNRLIEPWMGITVIISATEWNNFFCLRCHEDAQPEIRVAAEGMQRAIWASIPESIGDGGWHLPLTTDAERQMLPHVKLIELSVARCARVSYLTHDGQRDYEADHELYRRLANSGHWSPFEHVASPYVNAATRCGNFIGWHQHRADADPRFIQ